MEHYLVHHRQGEGEGAGLHQEGEVLGDQEEEEDHLDLYREHTDTQKTVTAWMMTVVPHSVHNHSKYIVSKCINMYVVNTLNYSDMINQHFTP